MYKRLFALLVFFVLYSVTICQTRNLDYYLNQGLQNSPLLKDYQNQISSALIDSIIIRSVKMLQIEGKSQLLYTPVYKNFGYDEVITDGGNYQGIVGVTKPIFNKREIDQKYKAVNIQKQSVVNASKISVTELKKIITDQYLISYADYSDLVFNKSFLHLLNDENEIVRQFVAKGIFKQTEYLSLLIETQGQEILVNQLNNQYNKDMRSLNQLCGLRDTGLYELIMPDLTVNGSPNIARAPLYTQFKIDSLKIINEKIAVDVRYQPKINLFADAGVLTHNPWDFYKHFGYSAGLNFTVPIYDGHQKNYEKQKLDIFENTRTFYKDNFVKKYEQQVLQLNEELKALKEISVQMERQLSTSNQLIVDSKALLNSGNITMMEYITAVKNFRNISRNLNQIRVQMLQVITEQNYLIAQ